MLCGAVDEHDPVVGREPTPQLARSHQPTGAATQDDGAASRADGSAGARLRPSGALVHLLDRDREARLVELVLREDHLAVRPHQHAPRNPAVRERTEQRPVTVGDHRERETVLLLPGGAGLLGLDRADVDDLEPVFREPLMEPDDGRTLLPTALSGRLPEDQQHPVRPVDRQT